MGIAAGMRVAGEGAEDGDGLRVGLVMGMVAAEIRRAWVPGELLPPDVAGEGAEDGGGLRVGLVMGRLRRT